MTNIEEINIELFLFDPRFFQYIHLIGKKENVNYGLDKSDERAGQCLAYTISSRG